MMKQDELNNLLSVDPVELAVVFEASIRITMKYYRKYDGELQGLCSLIAQDIIDKIGGVPIAGYIKYGSGNKRTHWWVDFMGVRIDPIVGIMFNTNDYPKHVEVHRDWKLFKKEVADKKAYRIP